jgi:hypothetical protein
MLLVNELNLTDIADSLERCGFDVRTEIKDTRIYNVLISGFFDDPNVDVVLNINGTWYVHDRK